MKLELFSEYRKKFPGFETKNCKLIDPNKIYFDEISQTRKNGHVLQNVPRMMEVMREKFHQNKAYDIPPVSTKPCADPEYSDTAIDGITRILAGVRLSKEIPEFKILVSDFWYKRNNPSQSEIEIFQAEQNDHSISSANTKDDIERQIKRLHDNNFFVSSLGCSYHSNAEEYMKGMATHCAKTYKHAGIKWKSLVKRVLTKESSTKYEARNSENVTEFTSDCSTIKWSGEGSGDIVNNETIYSFGSVSKFDKFALGGAWLKRLKNPNIKIYAIGFIDSTVGMDDTKFLQERKRIEEAYDKVQKHLSVEISPSIKKKIFDGLYFVPQILTGQNKENMTVLKHSR